MSKNSFLNKLGPGLIYAGAAVGVSHLVQSTRAGALYGLGLIGYVILANILKYPFFEVAPRYVAKTGQNLLHGYRSLGSWALPAFAFITFSTLFIVVAAVSIVTGGIAAFVFGITNALNWSLFILLACGLLLILGRYSGLDSVMKWLVICLTLCTVIAVVLSGVKTSELPASSFSFTDDLDVLFFIALIGWMPAPFDISVWNSMWIVEKQKTINTNNSDTLVDFHIGYWGTTLLAVLFILLGTFSLYQTDVEIPASATGFAQSLIGIYTDSIGDWAYYIIAFAALATMFSTTLTVLDGFSRVVQGLGKTYLPNSPINHKSWMPLAIIIPGSFLILLFALSSMREWIDFATTISFLTAPVLALMNLMVLRKANAWWKNKTTPLIAYLGITALLLFSSVYIYISFIK